MSSTSMEKREETAKKRKREGSRSNISSIAHRGGGKRRKMDDGAENAENGGARMAEKPTAAAAATEAAMGDQNADDAEILAKLQLVLLMKMPDLSPPNIGADHPFSLLSVKKLRRVAQELCVGIKRGWRRADILSALLHQVRSIKSAKVCQCHIRGYFVRRWHTSRGKRVLFAAALNESDFFSMEPIENIPRISTCAVVDKNNFSYTFNLHSLVALIKQAKQTRDAGAGAGAGAGEKHVELELVNPYTRERFTTEAVNRILDFCFLSSLLLHKFTQNHQGVDGDTALEWKQLERTLNDLNPGDSLTAAQRHQNETLRFLAERELMDTRSRIVNVFIDIDMMGNYSNINWFLALNLNALINYAVVIFDVWSNRDRIPEETKKSICPYRVPFADIESLRNIHIEYQERNGNFRQSVDVEIMRKYCLCVMENLVYMSKDIHYRKLGSMYVLMTLTAVSQEARAGLPWLYDGLF